MAAPTEIFVDPAINANSGSGTIGDPYGDLQHALTSYTWDTSNGNRLNIRDTAPEIVTALLTDPKMFLSDAAPVWLEGYSNTAGDGGFFTMDFNNGAYTIQYTNRMGFRRGRFRNSSASLALGGSSFVRPNFYTECEFTDLATVNVNHGLVSRCWVHHMRAGTQAVATGHSSAMIADTLTSDNQNSLYGFYLASGGTVVGTIIHESGSTLGLVGNSAQSLIQDITINSPVLGFSTGVRVTNGSPSVRGGNWLIVGKGTGAAFDCGVSSSWSVVQNVSAFGVASIYGGTGRLAPSISASHEILAENPITGGTLPTDFTAADFWEQVHSYFRPQSIGDVITASGRTRGAVQPISSSGTAGMLRRSSFRGGY